MLKFLVDHARCTQCGLCATDCPARIIELDDYPTIVNPDACIRCQHCLAICPTEAISILGNDPENELPINNAFPSPQQMATLIRGRRSTRQYLDESLPIDVIEDLLTTVHHAPTGVNAQQVLLTVVKNRQSVHTLREAVYTRLVQAIRDGENNDDMRMEVLGWAIKMWTKEGADVLFRGAPHVLIASAPQNCPTPLPDCFISLSYFELLAASAGLGSLWNGMLKWTLDELFPEFRDRLGIPRDHLVGYVMVFGKPAVKYMRTVSRTPGPIRIIDWKEGNGTGNS
ncbi:nitroreductase family protein [Desulfovibrio inopinatus]|uniref:nitroreductase family protein n=1 Tax=Desulfovibrio inopinatus TaxID=102109 RepID=UPI00040E0A76|nr:nitroreductase family protein [Desulfovibrio inopinatus]